MEILELKVQVEKSQLAQLDAEITKLKSQTIKLTVDASGIKSAGAALNKVSSSAQKLTTSAQKAASTTRAFTTEAGKASTTARTYAEGMTKAGTAAKTYSDGAGKAARGTKTFAESAEKASKLTSLLGDSVGRVAAKMAVWQVMGDLVATPIRAVKEALSTMKAVDDQLVDVRKVTDFTEGQMKSLEKQAYSTASAYGVAADQYLESVAAFARAGYQEQSEALAELSTKTQIVGDTNAKTANQFLLAVDAAYQYKGSVEKLGAVLDGVNEIDNKYATSIENIAEGLGKVAPISAQAHVGIDELSAALGTITAVTQRSGTEAATALRALFLNIMGDTKTEIDEGVTWTTGEIAGLRDVLNLYASDVVAAADATGSLINPMEAIGALSQSMKDGVLTEQKLMEMVSDIGGKLRSSQLLALIQNWDMYESMLADYGNAIGSADREVENAMDSWTRKTETLKNTWTEFVSHMVETDAIKGALDGVTGTIKVLDSDLGQTAIQIGVVTGAVTLLSKGVTALKGAAAAKAGAMAFGPIAEGATTAGLAAKTFLASINPVTATILAVAAAAVVLPKIVDALTVSLEEQREKVEELQSEYDSLYGSGSEYESLAAKVGNLTKTEEKRLQVLKAQKEAMEAELQAAKELEFQKFQEEQGSGKTVKPDTVTDSTADVEKLKRLTKEQENFNQALLEGKQGEEDYRESLQGLISENQTYYDDLKNYQAQGMELSQAQKEFIQNYENIADRISTVESGSMGARLAVESLMEALQSDGSAGENFRNLAEEYQEFMAQFEAGAYSSKDYKDFVNAFLPEEIMDELGGDYKAAGELIANEFWQGVFSSGGDDYGAEFANALYRIADENGEVIDSNGDVVASFEEVDGTLSMAVDDAAALAEYLGTTEDVILAVGDALGFFGDGLAGSEDSIIAMAADMGALTLAAEEAADGLAHIDLDSLVQGLVNAGASEQQIQGLVGALQNAQGIRLDGPVGDLDNLIQKAQDSKGKVDELDTTVTTTVEADTAAAQSKLDTVSSTLSKLDGRSATVTVHTVNTTTTEARAEGDSNYHGGPTLVNEEGPELIREGSRARIVAGGKPAMANVAPGAQIFTAQETKEILSGHREQDIVMPAMAGGFKVGGIPISTGTAGSTSGSKGNASTGGGKKTSGATAKSAGKATRPAKSSGRSSSSSSKDARQEELEDQVKLLESELDLMEAQGKPASELAGKMQEIQGALNAQAEYMRSIGADQADINKLSTEWWKVREDITKAYREEMEDERDLLQSQIDLMEKQGGQTKERISRLEEIQASLHEEAEYLRSIGEEQEEINKLSAEWWKTQEEIKKIQEDLWDELDEAVSKELERAKEARDEEIDALDKQLEAMKKAREEKDEQLALEEKILAVQEAQEALANAQNERTIRTYNAATGQWEWVADQSAVKDAEEALEDAQKDLDDYREDLAYEAAVAAIEERKTAINDAYDALEAGWDSIVESVQEPTRDISEILKDIAENGTPLMKAQVETTGRLLGDLNNYISAAVSSKTGDSYVGGGGTSSKDYSNDTTDYSALMRQATSEAAFNYWAEQRENKITAQGIDTSAEGWKSNAEIYKEWTEKSGGTSSDGGSSSGGGSTSKGSSSSKVSSGISNAVSSLAAAITSKATKSKSKKLYDGGGVLEGLGGIKATAADEMVLPPDITAAMLAPSADSTFQARVKELGLLYGGNLGRGIPMAGTVQNRSSQDHYGDSYQFGDVTLTENQAKSMTVYDLAQMSRNLSLYGWR